MAKTKTAKKTKKVKKECWRCGGKGEVMPSPKMFLTILGFMDAEPVPCPICHPEYWVKYPVEKQWTIED